MRFLFIKRPPSFGGTLSPKLDYRGTNRTIIAYETSPNCLRLGLRPRLRWGSLRRSPCPTDKLSPRKQAWLQRSRDTWSMKFNRKYVGPYAIPSRGVSAYWSVGMDAPGPWPPPETTGPQIPVCGVQKIP